LTNYLDENKSGDVDFTEFNAKINFKDYQKRSHKFLISELNFTERVLEEWYKHRAQEH
jgi:hypothetical protein